MIPGLNVNKQRISTTLGQPILQRLSTGRYAVGTGRYAEFSFQETKSLSSYAGLIGVLTH